MASNDHHKVSTTASKVNSKIEPSMFGGHEAMEINIAANRAPPPPDHNDPLHDKEHGSAQHQQKDGLLGKLKSHLPGHSKEHEANDGKRESTSKSWPYVFPSNPVLQMNPRWPNKENGKKEKEVEVCFGGRVG